MKLKILSPGKTIYDGNSDSIILPSKHCGAFLVMEDHAPIVAALEEGIVKYTVDGEDYEFQISGGFAEVRNNNVSVCVEIKPN